MKMGTSTALCSRYTRMNVTDIQIQYCTLHARSLTCGLVAHTYERYTHIYT